MSEKAINSLLMVMAVLTIGILTIYASSNCRQTEQEATATIPARKTAQPVPTATLPPLLPTPFHTAVIGAPLTPEPTRTPVRTPAASPTTEPTPQTGGTVYIVQSGDTLYSIARRFGLSTQALATANNIADPSHIWVGQRLVIPGGSASPSPVSTPSPTATPASTSSYDFALEKLENIPNCGLTQVWGYIRDAAGNGLSNYTVRVTTADGSWSTVSNPSDASGYYDIVLAPGAKAGKWQVFVVAADGSKLSSVVDVETTATDCQPGGKGVQTPRLDFKRRW